jgi:hypothetical protein
VSLRDAVRPGQGGAKKGDVAERRILVFPYVLMKSTICLIDDEYQDSFFFHFLASAKSEIQIGCLQLAGERESPNLESE